MRFLLTALGSYGDVHPFVGIGRTLAARGHDVSIVANPHFGSLIRTAGLAHIPLGAPEEYEQLTANPNVWGRFKGPMIVLRDGMAGQARKIYEVVTDRCAGGETVVVAHGLDFGSRIAHEKHGIPLATIALAPLQIRSTICPPIIASFFTRRWPIEWPKRLQYWAIDRLVADRILSGPVNRFRAELGLSPPVKRFLDVWWYSPQLVICLFPDWFAPPQSDWPPNTIQAGFPLWDESDHADLSGDVATFLDAGEPPIVFVPGSAMLFGHDFFAAAVEACRLLRRRGILLTKYPEQIPGKLPAGVRHFDFVPLSQLLPRAAAYVHHGGIGSSSQGLAAGVPQLIMPRNFDQPDNADRLRRLGVGEILTPRRFRAPAVAAALERLISTGGSADRRRELASHCDGPKALSTACEALERLGRA